MSTYDFEQSKWSLALDTAAGRAIDNWQQFEEFTDGEVAQFQDQMRAYNARARSQPMSRYNCHGMTFAARRTWLSSEAVEQILKEDGYTDVRIIDVLEGDVVVYYQVGKAWHSGIVVGQPTELGLPLICSKWGALGEAIHWANQCPFEKGDTRYYRITNAKYAHESGRSDPSIIDITSRISFSQRR